MEKERRIKKPMVLWVSISLGVKIQNLKWIDRPLVDHVQIFREYT